MRTVSVAPPPAIRGPADDAPARPQCAAAEEDEADRNRDGGENDNGDNSQESHTQQILTQTQADLTQLGCDDAPDDPFASQCTQGGGCGGQTPAPVDPLSVPWGRLMPVGGGSEGGNGCGADGIRTGRAAEMLPQPPEARRGKGGGGGDGGSRQQSQLTPPPDAGVSFLGLRGLRPGDRFNEYTIGRSAKADVTAQKLVDGGDANNGRSGRQRRHDFIHAMVSNRHCRVYCLLGPSPSGRGSGRAGGEMEVFAEDTSGNGTLVNGTTLLRRNERRRLHTGDVICLLNPRLLERKLRSPADRKAYVGQYSYVFVNLYEQEARHGWDDPTAACGIGSGSGRHGMPSAGRHGTGRGPSGGSGGGASLGGGGNSSGRGARRSGGGGKTPSNARRTPAAVNVRAMRCHSAAAGGGRRSQPGRRGERGGGVAAGPTEGGEPAGGDGGRRTTDLVRRPPPARPRDRPPRPPAAADARGAGTASASAPGPKSSLGSFLKSSAGRRVEDEYDLRDLLGRGTCGEVRRAIHRRSGEERAVKVISIGGRQNSAIYSPDRLTSIQAEATILRSLDHPYVVRMHDMFVSPNKAIYLVMDYVRGGDLFDRIVERERYTEVQARRLMRRVLSAVHYLHEERGIVHRDLKPENILVVDRRSDIDVKLTDFGLAKNMTAEGLKTFCGTPQYFAPEVLRRGSTVHGEGRYGKEIDCWSVGVILFILLSGGPPFDVTAGLDAVADADVVFYEDQWRGVSPEARDLVARLLEREPRRRIAVKDACEHPWILVEDGDTHVHPLEDPKVRGGDERRRRRELEEAGGEAGEPDASSAATAEVKSRQTSSESRSEPSATARVLPPGKAEACSPKPAADPSKSTPSDASPVCRGNSSSAVSAKPPIEEGTDGRSSLLLATAKPPPSSSGSISAQLREKFLQSKPSARRGDEGPDRQSAPEQRQDQQQRRQQRCASIWPAANGDGGAAATTAIRQACDECRPSPNCSPVKKRYLFDAAGAAAAAASAAGKGAARTEAGRGGQPRSADAGDGGAGPKEPSAAAALAAASAVRRVKRRERASIESAGDTLPKPTIAEDAVLLNVAKEKPAKKKKVQTTLFPPPAAATTTADEGVGPTEEEETGDSHNEHSGVRRRSACSKDSEEATSTAETANKRKRVSESPPRDERREAGLVFNLKKRHRGGGGCGEIPTAETAGGRRSELSDDELRSDFSDDDEGGECDAAVAARGDGTKKNSMERYLQRGQRQNTGRADSIASFGGDEPAASGRGGAGPDAPCDAAQLRLPRPVSKDEGPAGEPGGAEGGGGRPSGGKRQSYLFGKGPPAAAAIDDGTADEVCAATGRQEDDDDVGPPIGPAGGAKGRQRSIRSWFRPKK